MTTNGRTPVSSTGCDHCGATTSNGLVLCKRCRGTLTVALENIGTYHGDLLSLGGEVTRIRVRRAEVNDPTGRAVALQSAPKDPADEAAADTKAMLVGWARVLVSDRPQLAYPRDTVAGLVAFLAKHVSTVATLEWADAFLREALGLERRLRAIVERGRGRWYAGICSGVVREELPHDEGSCACACHRGAEACDVPDGCGPESDTIPAEFCDRDLYAVPGTSYVRCPACGQHWPVAERRAVLLAEARDTLLPISVIASAAVTLLGKEPSVSRLENRLRKWAERGQIRSYGVKVIAGQERRVYALGEVLDMLTAEASGLAG